MKYSNQIAICILVFFFSGVVHLSAQSFNSFQSINKHTFYFSITWQNKILVGAGYAYRTADTKFSDISAEWKAPIAQLFTWKNYEVIAGTHNRFNANKNVVSAGFHLKYKRATTDIRKISTLGLSLTFIPGYQYARSLSDGASGVIAARFTYQPTLFASIKDIENNSVQTKAFAEHLVKFGAHYDILLKRNLSLSANPVIAKIWTSEGLTLDDSPDWDFNFDFYFGPSYWLARD